MKNIFIGAIYVIIANILLFVLKELVGFERTIISSLSFLLVVRYFDDEN